MYATNTVQLAKQNVCFYMEYRKKTPSDMFLWNMLSKTIFISSASFKLFFFWEMLNKQSNRKISTSEAWNLYSYPLAIIIARKWSKPTVTKTFESESKILQLTTYEKKFEICVFQVPHSFICPCHRYELCRLGDEERPISQVSS